MTRLPDWQVKYALFLTSHRKVPYAWGTSDCCTFAADGVKAMTGVDIAEDFRGYKTQKGAYGAIKRVCGGSSAADAAAYGSKKYDIPELSTVLLAQRGDLLLVENAGSVITGLVSMHGQAVCVTDKGLYSFPIHSAIKAYRV